MKLRGFSLNTEKSYLLHNQHFLEFIKKEPAQVTETDLKLYLAGLLTNQEKSSVAIARSALLFYYNEILKKEIRGIKTPRLAKKLPVTLSKEEIKQLIAAAAQEKSKLLIKMLYGSGLRISEALKLKVEDLEAEQHIGWVRGGKGGKDRMIILSQGVLAELKHYLGQQGVRSGIIFTGKNNKPMSARNAQKIGHRPRLQARRHLRGRVRGVHALLLLDL